MLAENFAQVLSRFDSLNHVLKCIDELENAYLTQTQRSFRHGRGRTAIARENTFLFKFPRVQLRGRFLEFLVLNELAD